jgi:hypothetical protein
MRVRVRNWDERVVQHWDITYSGCANCPPVRNLRAYRIPDVNIERIACEWCQDKPYCQTYDYDDE